MKNLIGKCIDDIGAGHLVNIAIVEFFHHHHRSIGDGSRPLLFVGKDGADDLLCFLDLFEVVERIGEKFHQPFPAFDRLGEIELVKNREFLFMLKDGKIVESGIVELHRQMVGTIYYNLSVES